MGAEEDKLERVIARLTELVERQERNNREMTSLSLSHHELKIIIEQINIKLTKGAVDRDLILTLLKLLVERTEPKGDKKIE